MSNYEVSRCLSRILRHKAADEGLSVRSDGFVFLDDLLARPKLRKLNVTVAKVQDVVEKDGKARYTLVNESTGLWIRANQGHSLEVVDLALTEVCEPLEAIHGTFQRCLPSILESGLSKMKRNHIHLATGLPGSGVTSGIRKSCDVFIYIDVARALQDGIKFYRSSNGVILTAGVDGVLHRQYFSKVVDRDGQVLHDLVEG